MDPPHLRAADDRRRPPFDAAPEFARLTVPDRALEAVSAVVQPAAAASVLRVGDRGRNGHDDLRIVAQQPGLRTGARAAAAGKPRPRPGRHHERLSLAALPRPGTPRRAHSPETESHRNLA